MYPWPTLGLPAARDRHTLRGMSTDPLARPPGGYPPPPSVGGVPSFQSPSSHTGSRVTGLAGRRDSLAEVYPFGVRYGVRLRDGTEAIEEVMLEVGGGVDVKEWEVPRFYWGGWAR